MYDAILFFFSNIIGMNRSRISSNLNLPRAHSELRSYESLSEQFRKSWLIAFIGFIGFTSGIWLLIWNEGRAVETTKSLEDAIMSVVPVGSNSPVDPANTGKLIHLTGEVLVQEPLTEVDYGVSVMAVKLKRRVQMFQWVEEETKNINTDGEVPDSSFSTYYYYTEWRDKLIDASSFHTSMGHWNPKEFPLKSVTQVNENVKIGNYELSFELKDKFSDYVSFTSDERPERKDIKLHAGLYYHSQDVWNPEVGDIRIQFSYAGQHGQIVTVVGKQGENGAIIPFKSRLGLNILILKIGRFTVEEVFLSEHAQNRVRTWLFRGSGWFLLYLGCICLTTILRALIVRSRLLRQMLPTGNSSLKMTVSMSTSLLVTAVAWMWYRPIFGLCLIMVTFIFLLITRFITTGHSNNYQRL